MSQSTQATMAYSIDSDLQGIRQRVAAAITGALAFGAQNTNRPPAGHWLESFWTAGRAERAEAERLNAILAAKPDDLVSRWLTRAAQATAEAGPQATAPVTKGRHQAAIAAIAICQQVSDHHLRQLRSALAAHGYHNAVTEAHGYQYLGAQRCIEILRIASRAEG